MALSDKPDKEGFVTAYMTAPLKLDTRIGDYMRTYSGGRFYPLDPRPEDMNMNDIVQGLALQCRYAGQIHDFYSVAEHSCILADYTRDVLGFGPDDEFEALMHDAPEAYVTDVPRPIKHQTSDFVAMEARVERVIRKNWGMRPEKPSWMAEIDTRICMDEKAVLMPYRPDHDSSPMWRIGEPLGVKIHCWPWKQARSEFMTRFVDILRRQALGNS